MKKYSILFVLMLLVVLVGCTETERQPKIEDLVDDTPIVDEKPSPYDEDIVINDGTTCEDSVKDGYVAVWCEEFNYEGLPDETKWTYDVGGSGWGNNEKQYYTDAREENAYVSDGGLTITAQKEFYQGSNYTSARLISKDRGDFLYGRIEVRAALPTGRGTWPAIWMLPTDWEYGGWPASGEIDIMEHVGYDMNRIHGTVHTENYNHSKGTQVGKSMVLDDVVNTFHVYAIEWDADEIRFFINDTHYFTFKNDDEMNPDGSYKNWPFDKRHHLLLNIAIGGFWGGAQGIDPELEMARMIFDYVRVYQKDYANLDTENPSTVSNFELESNMPGNTHIRFDQATDDMGIKEYEIYLDGEFVKTVSRNMVELDGLDEMTDYTLGVISVDFTDKKSAQVDYAFTTGDYPTITSRIEAEHYTSMNGVEIESTSDTGGGSNVGWIGTGDFMTYSLKVEEAGTYTVNYRYASESTGGGVRLYQDDQELVASTFTATGGWQTWSTTTSESFDLEVGTYTFKILASPGGFNLNWLEFNKVNE